MIVNPNEEQKLIYTRFCHYLNRNGGKLDANDAVYYRFLDVERITHETLVIAIKLCHRLYPQKPYVLHIDARTVKVEGGAFYLTKTGTDIISNAELEDMPPIEGEERKKIVQELLPEILKAPTSNTKQRKDAEWSKDEVIELLTTQAHIVGRMLGTGYDLMEQIHSDWIAEWITNPKGLRVTIHQAHRDSYKTSAARLMLAIMLILQPTKTIIIIRKSEDAVKEIVNGVSKILDTPLFKTFVNILYPYMNKFGGFKKTTDTALAIDTNLNVSLSGEYQLRALGLGSPLTGKHASLIITDDIVSITDRESEAERRSTISKYQEMMNLLSNNKGFSDTRILNIGTPWHEEDAFNLMERGLKLKTEEQKELEEIPVKKRTEEQSERIRRLDMFRGKFVYNCYQTGLMTIEDIEWKRQVLNDEVLFAANYLLTLVSDEECPFPRIKNTGVYSKDFFAESYETYAHIDAKYSGIDTCALTIGAYDWDNNITVVYGRLWKVPIDQNYLELAEIMYNCGVQKLYMETNTDKGLMGDKFREVGFDTEGYHEHTNKNTKIVNTLRPFWREKGDYALPCVHFTSETDEEYLSQIYNYKRGVKKDDAPDSLASLLLKSKFGRLAVRIT